MADLSLEGAELDAAVAKALALLEHSYAMNQTWQERPVSRLEYLADHIFDFTTYDGGVSEHFAQKAVEVCAAISDRRTHEYIKDLEQYQWYLLMCNMPFFVDRLEWGTSIRGAWWSVPDGGQKLSSCGIWEGDEQVLDLTFDPPEWESFISAMRAFVAAKGTP